jgi:hypothetical protein
VRRKDSDLTQPTNARDAGPVPGPDGAHRSSGGLQWLAHPSSARIWPTSVSLAAGIAQRFAAPREALVDEPASIARLMCRHEQLLRHAAPSCRVEYASQHRRRSASLEDRLFGRGNGQPEASREIAAHSTAASPNSSQTGLAAGFLPAVATERLSRGAWGQSPLRSTAAFELTRTAILPGLNCGRNVLAYRVSAEAGRRSAAERPCSSRWAFTASSAWPLA